MVLLLESHKNMIGYIEIIFVAPLDLQKAVNYLVPVPAEMYSRINANALLKNIKKNLGKCILNSQVKLTALPYLSSLERAEAF